ncbi:acyl-CoA carboxylase subunit beta [Solimonas sp. K1W22B-7]|uniref:acyl-CoA carboxylase subunit beta n=1 Tax=Solimonas sp. K1W22B-7 TaxID=2303331 RepID=UPI000E333BC7|nr:carboxyl transferase domain-containing protein [Solimonas sp. K1W22B-7]AXQ31130.1 acyl-CoA carboxylase subunit beta [Solimonas sp. K1W22B-7]
MAVFRSRITVTSDEFRRNREGMLGLVEQFRALEDRARIASERSSARFTARGQLLPRERLARLLDPGAPYLEICNLAGYAMTDNGQDAPRETSIPGGSLLAGIGFVSGARCVVAVTDSGINAGALPAAAIQKILRVQMISQENRLPFVHLVESAGASIPAFRVEGFVRGGELFANLARLSAAGIPVITVLHGSSTAGGAYMPGLSDVVVAVRGRGKAFLAGPPLLKAATGEIANDEELGGAQMHAEVSGLVEYLAEDDSDAIRLVRQVVARLAWGAQTLRPVPSGFAPPNYDPDEIAGIVPLDYRRPYDVREVVARVVDGSDLCDFKSRYGAATVCMEAEVHGRPVAFIGNNGPIDNEGATKAAHFIQHCCQVGTPITYLQNTTGFMVGTAYERSGMVKHGSKLIQAVATASVPQFTIMTGASYGAGNFGMCGRGFDPRFLMSWPNSKIGLMGPEQAGMTMRIVAEAAALRKGASLPEAQFATKEQEIIDLLNRQADAFYTSGRVIDDGVIDPRDTRRVLAFLLATAAEAGQLIPRPLSFGVARL